MTTRRDARRTTSPLAPPTGGMVEMPDDLRRKPPMPFTLADYVAWRQRQREWLAAHDLLDDRGLPMWSRITPRVDALTRAAMRHGSSGSAEGRQ